MRREDYVLPATQVLMGRKFGTTEPFMSTLLLETDKSVRLLLTSTWDRAWRLVEPWYRDPPRS